MIIGMLKACLGPSISGDLEWIILVPPIKIEAPIASEIRTILKFLLLIYPLPFLRAFGEWNAFTS
jgi:hypothetical protein